MSDTNSSKLCSWWLIKFQLQTWQTHRHEQKSLHFFNNLWLDLIVTLGHRGEAQSIGWTQECFIIWLAYPPYTSPIHLYSNPTTNKPACIWIVTHKPLKGSYKSYKLNLRGQTKAWGNLAVVICKQLNLATGWMFMIKKKPYNKWIYKKKIYKHQDPKYIMKCIH